MKYIIYTLGCKVNQYETQAIEALLVSRGHKPCAEGEIADVVIVNTCYGTDSTIYPTAVIVILDKYNLCTRLQHQVFGSGQTTFRKVPLYFTFKSYRITGKFGQFFIIDIVHIIPSCSESDVHIFFTLFYLCTISCIK